MLENSTIDGIWKLLKRINGARVLGSSKTFETFFLDEPFDGVWAIHVTRLETP
jgi:hypothetical protein